MIELMKSPRAGKRFAVCWAGRVIHFGQPGAFTYADGAGHAKRAAYLARHGAAKSGEDWTDPTTAGYWARWLLWEKRGIGNGLAEAVRRLNV